MERLDKIIGRETGYSRKDIKILVKNKRIKVNDEIVLKSDIKISENDIIKLDNNIIDINEYVYLVLNKPKGYISATEDEKDSTVLDLIDDKYRHRNLFPAGRLDKDTTGLMIITDDGAFAHDILSPKKHVEKTYNVKIDIPITDEMIIGFKNGVELIDGECKSAILEKIGEYTCRVTLTEGRYHQIKRMFGCFSAKVVELERIKMGNFYLPSDLEIGKYRMLTKEELKLIKGEKV